MQIHELNNFTGTLGSGAYLAVDDGNDTGKLSTQQLLAATEARIDNIIAGPAPSAEEIVDARRGADGVTYNSLGTAIRTQVTDLKSDIKKFAFDTDYLGLVPIVESSYVTATGTFESHTLLDRTDYIEIPKGAKHIKVFAGLPSGSNVYALNDCVAYYNSAKVFIGTCGASQSRTALSTYEVPSNASYIIVNLAKQKPNPDITAVIFDSVEQIVSGIENEITVRTAEVCDITDTEMLTPSFINNGYYHYASGEYVENNNFLSTDKIAIGDIDRLEYIGMPAMNCLNVAFFNGDTYYGGVSVDVTATKIEKLTAHVPLGTTHYALSYYKNSPINYYSAHRRTPINESRNVYGDSIVLGYINKYGSVKTEWTSKYFNLSPRILVGNAKSVLYNLCLITNMMGIAFYTEEGTFISGVSVTASTPTLVNGVANVPNDAHYMAFSYVNGTYATGIDFSECYVTLSPIGAELSGKKWLAIGDSITAGETNNSKSYVDYLNGFITTEKEGHSGYSLLTLYQLRESFPTDADIVTIFAGTNDFNVSRPLGVITDMETTPTKLTFYGEINQFMKWAVETFPTKPVIFVTPIWRNCTAEGNISGMVDNNGVDLHEYCEAIQACGKKYGVIVADFMNESGFGEYNIAQLTNDGLHPNDIGQKRLSTLFKAILEQYL